MIHILIVSAIRLYRDGLAHVLGREDRVRVVGAFDRPERSVEHLATGAPRPDVLLLDTADAAALRHMPLLRAAFPQVAVVALGVAPQDDNVLACAEAGVSGYVFRDASIEELLATVESAARGELRCSPEMAGMLLRRVANLACSAMPGGSVGFTRREQEIMDLVERGFSNKQISASLCIEVATVKNHVHNLLAKLDVHTRSEASAKWRRRPGARTSGPVMRIDARSVRG